MTKATVYSAIVFTITLIVGLLIAWQAHDVLLLGFAAILLAIFLSSITDWASEKFKLSYNLVLTGVSVLLAIFMVLIFWISAPLIGEQLKLLLEELPKAYDLLRAKASAYVDWHLLTKEKLTSEFIFNNEKLLNQATSIFSFTLGTITSFIIFIFVGLYLAFSPEQYIKGFLKIFPPKKRNYVEGILKKIGQALRWWLLGKFIAMAIVGTLIFLGLWILQVPLLLILSLLAAILTFIPYIGPILAAIPAILITMSIDPWQAIYVALLYIVVHTIEGYLISPCIDQRTVAIPPALTVMVQVLLMLLIGFIGLALASPLTVVALALIKELYVKKSDKQIA